MMTASFIQHKFIHEKLNALKQTATTKQGKHKTTMASNEAQTAQKRYTDTFAHLHQCSTTKAQLVAMQLTPEHCCTLHSMYSFFSSKPTRTQSPEFTSHSVLLAAYGGHGQTMWKQNSGSHSIDKVVRQPLQHNITNYIQALRVCFYVLVICYFLSYCVFVSSKFIGLYCMCRLCHQLLTCANKHKSLIIAISDLWVGMPSMDIHPKLHLMLNCDSNRNINETLVELMDILMLLRCKSKLLCRKFYFRIQFTIFAKWSTLKRQNNVDSGFLYAQRRDAAIIFCAREQPCSDDQIG